MKNTTHKEQRVLIQEMDRDELIEAFGEAVRQAHRDEDTGRDSGAANEADRMAEELRSQHGVDPDEL